MSIIKEPDKDLHRALGEDQIDAADDTMEDVLNGVYDDALTDDIESVMDADDDRESEEEIPDDEAAIARAIVRECEGVDEDGMPKVTVAIALDQVNPYAKTRATVAQSAFCKPVLKVCIRQEFLELQFDFKSASDRDLHVLWTHLEKFGDLSNSVEETSEEIPFFTFVLVPFSALGTCYMTAVNPIAWYLQPAKPGEECTQIRVLLHAEDLEFYETDEISLETVEATGQRVLRNRREAYEKAMEADDAAAEALEKSNQILEDLRRNSNV